MTDDPYESAAWKRYAKHAQDELVPKLRASAMTISLMPSDGDFDAKFALELGASIMLDKPIVIVASPGQVLPAALERIAVAVVRGDLADTTTRANIQQAIEAALGAADKEKD